MTLKRVTYILHVAVFFLPSKFIQDKYSGYSQKEAAYIAGAVYDSSLVLSASVGILIVSICDLNLFLNLLFDSK